MLSTILKYFMTYINFLILRIDYAIAFLCDSILPALCIIERDLIYRKVKLSTKVILRTFSIIVFRLVLLEIMF